MSNEAYDQKNNDDYEAITSALNIALIDLENNKKMTSLDVYDLQSILATAKDS